MDAGLKKYGEEKAKHDGHDVRRMFGEFECFNCNTRVALFIKHGDPFDSNRSGEFSLFINGKEAK